MIGCELHLESIVAKDPFREIHNGGIVHEDVECGNIAPRKKLARSLMDGFLAREIEFESTIVYFRKLQSECIDVFLNSR